MRFVVTETSDESKKDFFEICDEDKMITKHGMAPEKIQKVHK